MVLASLPDVLANLICLLFLLYLQVSTNILLFTDEFDTLTLHVLCHFLFPLLVRGSIFWDKIIFSKFDDFLWVLKYLFYFGINSPCRKLLPFWNLVQPFWNLVFLLWHILEYEISKPSVELDICKVVPFFF